MNISTTWICCDLICQLWREVNPKVFTSLLTTWTVQGLDQSPEWNAMQRLSPSVSVTQSPFRLLSSPSPPNATDSYRSNQNPKQFPGCTSHCLFTDLFLICQCVFYEELGHFWMTAPLQSMLNVKDSWVIKFWSLLLPASALHHPFISRSGSISEVISICPTYFWRPFQLVTSYIQ